MHTRFTTLVGCELPIQSAGIGAGAGPELVVAVSEAGGLGMLGMARPGASAATLAPLLDTIAAGTAKPFGVNFLITKPEDVVPEMFALAASRARVVEFFWGTPDPALVDLVHHHGAICAWQVGDVAEAVAAARAGCDFVIAQGVEAGGHVRGTTPLFELLPQVLAAVEVPVLAAGGLGTAADVARAIVAGAGGVRIGTRFIAAREANIHPEYLAAIIAASGDDTVHTSLFSRHWNAPHRVLKSCVEAASAFSGDVVGSRRALDGTMAPFDRLAPGVADKSTTGTIAAMPLWAGTGVGAIRRQQPAAEIVRELAANLG